MSDPPSIMSLMVDTQPAPDSATPPEGKDARKVTSRRNFQSAGGVDEARELLHFEAAHPTWTGTKEERIMSELGLRPARYLVLLHRAVQTREALEHDPVTTHRILRRLEASA